MSSEKESGESTIVVAVTSEEASQDRAPPSSEVLVAGRYRLGRRIGKGGMGEVMAARDEQIGRDVAIKRMRAANPSERAILRFLREASVQGRLEHPAIVPVHEIGRDSDGLPFFVMKKLTGTSLAQILVDEDRASFPLQRILRVFADVCLAVEFAHVRGIVHRDLKADNIMLGDYGEAYVLDWGVAKLVGEHDGDFADVGGSGEHATTVGTAIGTPGYMAPEQVRGQADIDGRADVYTLGCLLFELLSGEPLHPRGFHGLQSALTETEARPSRRAPDRVIPPELDALCVEATAFDREKRIATARELGSRVQRFLDGDRDLAMRGVLARDHLLRAQSAFSAGDSAEHRRTAMRDAAAALALDPKLDGAAELVGRLMLEPPREEPHDVTVAIAADDLRSARSIARAGLWAVAGSVMFLPLLWWIAPAGSRYVIALSAMLLLNGVVAIHAVRANKPRPGLVLLANAVIVILLARMFSPILIAPGVAASLTMGMVMTPRRSWVGSSVTVSFLMISSVLAPLILERTGFLTPTMSVDARGILFGAPALGGLEGPTVIVAALYTILLITGAGIAGEAIHARTRSAARHLHLQAWQLRQLVPR